MAALIHLGLLAALAWGVRWPREAVIVNVQAELWSALPVSAPPPIMASPVLPPPTPPATQTPLPDPKIVWAQEKQHLQKEQAQAREKERQQKLENQRQEKLRHEKALLEKQREIQAKQQRDQMRKENLERLAQLAGTAQRTAGPSAQYGNLIKERIKPKIVFTEKVEGNPMAEVQVRTLPNGTIIGRELVKSSGIPAWDRAVLNAIDKTEALPRDLDGRVPSPLVITFRPKDYEN